MNELTYNNLKVSNLQIANKERFRNIPDICKELSINLGRLNDNL